MEWISVKDKLPDNTEVCGVCSYDKRPAVKMNNVCVCHDCLNFIKNRSKLEGNTPYIQLHIDTRYVAFARGS